MKILITAYTFDASAKTITFTDYNPVVLDSVLLITNVTDNIIIYNFADATKGGSVATNVLTLTYDTTAMADADDLMIYYDDTAQSSDTTDLATSALQTTANNYLDGINDSAVAVFGFAAPDVDSPGIIVKAFNLTTGASQQVIASAASKQIWVYGYAITCGDADGQTVQFLDETPTALTGIMEFVQYGGIAVSPSGNFGMPIWKCATDKDLDVTITGGDVDGFITYAIIDVS